MAADNQNQDEEFDGFENLDENFDSSVEDAALDDPALDAEFQDMEDALNEDVFAEEATTPAAKPKKKVNWFNIIIALVAVLGAGGLVLSKLAPQLLSGGVPEMAAPVVAGPDATPANAEAAAQAAVATPTGNAAPVQGGMLDNPDAFAELAQNNPAPAPKTNAIPDPFAGLEQNNQPAAPVPAGEVLPDVPMPAPITSAMPEPVVEQPAPAPVIEAAPAPAAPVMPVASEPMAVTVDTAAADALKGQVDTLSSRMDTIESKLDEALNNAALNRTAAAAPADDSRFDAIQQTLERLESRLDDISKQRSAPVRSANVDNEDRPAPVKKKKAPAKAKQQSGGQWDEPYKASASQTTPIGATGTATGNPSGWILRGAQPGQAIIGAAGGDIRQVSLGDSIPGIGQVTGIAPINGRWVIQGTQGRISQ